MVDDSDETTLGYLTTEPGVRDTNPDTTAAADDGPSAPVRVTLPPAGYDYGTLIGRGGMGEVVEARDRRMGRDIAIKRMKESRQTLSTTRFLREARIQGRLDHPAIVPVHELGVDEQGRPYFTMKRLIGRTLGEHISDQRPIQALLRAFVEVCMAIEQAHERGVVHRDLKPSNIMIGDYGEVYVIDWGIARVLAEEERVDGGGDIDTLDDGTKTGAMLGTPGYMAPEQIRGEPIEFAADVYALGAILFEILAGEPLHPRGTAAIAATLAHAQQSPAQRRPERTIPPELDKACFEALAEVAMMRPRARSLGDRVRRYLDGDRDLEQRKKLAVELLAEARTALAAPDGRALGLSLAGRALALDRESVEAAELVAKLLVEPPTEPPPEALAALEREADETARERRRFGSVVALSVFIFLAAIPFLEVRSWPWVLAFYGVHAAIGGFLYYSSRRKMPGYIWVIMATTLVAAVVWAQIAGPFLLVPVMVCATLLGLSANSRVMNNNWIAPVWAAIAVMLPLVLEWSGVVDRTTTIANGALQVRSGMYEVRDNTELVALTVANLMFVTIAAIYGLGSNRLAARMQRKIAIQNWQLSQISQIAKPPT